MNLSSVELSALERNGVEKGLKFAIAPRSQNADCWNCRRCRGEHLSIQRWPLLRRAKPPPKNIQKDVFNALISIKKDSDRLVLSAEKSNYAVLMDKQ